jgi:hypothetical protein
MRSAAPFDARRAGLKRDDIRLGEAQLRSILDRHDAFRLAHRESERIQGRRLAARCTA